MGTGHDSDLVKLDLLGRKRYRLQAKSSPCHRSLQKSGGHFDKERLLNSDSTTLLDFARLQIWILAPDSRKESWGGERERERERGTGRRRLLLPNQDLNLNPQPLGLKTCIFTARSSRDEMFDSS